MLPKIVGKLIIRLFDFLSQQKQKFHFTTSSAYFSSSEVNCKKSVMGGCFNLTTAMLLLLHIELNSWQRSLHERCPKHWINSSRKFQDHLQIQDNKINLNDDYNKNTFIIATTKIIMNNNICMYTYNNTVLESSSPSTSEAEITATSSIITLSFWLGIWSENWFSSTIPKAASYWARARDISS